MHTHKHTHIFKWYSERHPILSRPPTTIPNPIHVRNPSLSSCSFATVQDTNQLSEAYARGLFPDYRQWDRTLYQRHSQVRSLFPLSYLRLLFYLIAHEGHSLLSSSALGLHSIIFLGHSDILCSSRDRTKEPAAEALAFHFLQGRRTLLQPGSTETALGLQGG